jgi:enoyl-CoA hydratase
VMADREYQLMTYEKKGAAATITINRPKVMNALNTQLAAEMRDALADAENDDGIRAIVITGTGDRAFCAGADIGELAVLGGIQARDFSLLAQSLTTQIERVRKPVVAKINGICLGGGNEVAMACDFRIASEKAAFGQPEINLGIIPGMGGTQRLTRLIGRTKAMEMNMLGEMIPAAEAYRLGLVNKVVPPAELDKAGDDLVEKLAAKGPVALGMVKLAVNNGMDMDLNRGLYYEAECFGAACGTEDAKEGTRAFMEKRKAEFKGR